MYRIHDEIDLYLVDYSVGQVPSVLQNSDTIDIFKNINDVMFTKYIGDCRQLRPRLNTLEDLFPGKILENEFLSLLCRLVRGQYNMPLHYELVLNAQRELKFRNYHIAIIEAETAFEVYIAKIFLEVSVVIGQDRDSVLLYMENPRKLGLLKKRV
jgi:thiol-disulfide isomerase/thioredoxin